MGEIDESEAMAILQMETVSWSCFLLGPSSSSSFIVHFPCWTFFPNQALQLVLSNVHSFFSPRDFKPRRTHSSHDFFDHAYPLVGDLAKRDANSKMLNRTANIKRWRLRLVQMKIESLSKTSKYLQAAANTKF